MKQSLAIDRIAIGLLIWSCWMNQRFCRNSSINISINNRYHNRFIHFGRPIFNVNHNGAGVYNPDPFGIAHARVALAIYHSPNLRPGCRIITTQPLDSLTVSSAPYVANNCIYFKSHRLAGTNSIAIDLMTMEDFFLTICPQQSAIFSRWQLLLPVIAQWLHHSTCSRKDVT